MLTTVTKMKTKMTYDLLRAVVVSTMLVGAGCATVPHPVVTEKCYEFTQSVKVTCFSGDVPSLSGPTTKMCVDGLVWILTSAAKEKVMLIDARCTAVLDLPSEQKVLK